MQKRTVEVRMCKTNAVDEVLWTIESFERARKISKMSWAEAATNFANCLGHVPQTRLTNVQPGDFPVTEEGFNAMIERLIASLCSDVDAKGTLKQSIEKGDWVKPEDVEIIDHNQK